MQVPTLEDLQAVENRLSKQLSLINDRLEEIKPPKKWLKSAQFMELFDIKTKDTLAKMRDNNEVKAKLKGGVWYYDKDSFLS